MTIPRRGLKVKVMGQGQKSMQNVYYTSRPIYIAQWRN